MRIRDPFRRSCAGPGARGEGVGARRCVMWADALLAIEELWKYGAEMKGIAELRALPVVERIQLVEDLWDSIAEDSAGVPLTEVQLREIDRRLDDFEASPADGVTWESVKASLQGKR